MGKPDIVSWLASTEDGSILDREEDFGTFTLGDALDDWPAFIHKAQAHILSGRTRDRISLLTDLLLPFARNKELPTTNAFDLLRILTLTYPRYIDQASRKAVRTVLLALTKDRDDVLERSIGWVRLESGALCEKLGPSSSAPANRFVLATWCCDLYTQNIKSRDLFRNQKNADALLESLALLLDSLLRPEGQAKPAIRQTTISRTRRAIRSSPRDVNFVISTLVTLANRSPNNGALLVLLGLACDVVYHLKNVSIELKTIEQSTRNEILQLYNDSVLMSKTPVAADVFAAFDGFIRNSVTAEDLGNLLPAMEKASLRSPEIALPVLNNFFRAYAQELDKEKLRKLLTIVLNSSKSSNPRTRESTVTFAQALLPHSTDVSNEEHILNEIITATKTGKTTGPEHRLVLYSILGSVSPSQTTSRLVVENAPILLAKESNDSALSRLAENLVPHFVFAFSFEASLPSGSIKAAVQDLSSARPALRRATSLIIGTVLQDCGGGGKRSASLVELAETSRAGFEANLSTAGTSSTGPVDGYIAIAVLLGPVRRLATSGDTILKVLNLQTLAGTPVKPSFLLSAKIYQKLSVEEDEVWFLRALSVTMRVLESEIKGNLQLRRQVGCAFVHLAIHSGHVDTRRMAIKTLEEENKRTPEFVNQMLRDAIESSLEKVNATKAKENSTEDEGTPRQLLAPILSACAALSEDVAVEDKYALISNLLVLAHDPTVCGTSQDLWIRLCQRANVDPRELIENRRKDLVEIVLSQPPGETKDRAAMTLSFVAPDAIVPIFVSQIRSDLDPSVFAKVTDEGIGIWRTPEGTLYVDVLSSKPGIAVTRKGKDADIEKWEAELRASLSSKKAVANGTAPKALSKQEKEAVALQLRVESETRQKINEIFSNANRGLALLASIVKARVDILGTCFTEIIQLLLEGAVKLGAPLLGNNAFDSYIALANYCAERLGSTCKWVGVATIRCHNALIVPEEMQVEPLNSLILRILYKLRPLSEQEPFDGPTLSYISPLFGSIIRQSELIGANEEDEPLERIALILSVLNFHTREYADHSFPRSQTLQDILDIIRIYPSLGKDASSVLIALGEAMRANASIVETNVLIKNTVAGEAYVRNSSLQCLQAMDLTEFDWRPELWIACYDSDQQNGRLGRHIWEDNGLDVPENFFTDLKPFLLHEHACIRLSCAASLTEAVTQWPQKISDVFSSLQSFYREKVKKTGPEFDDYGILITRSIEASDPWPARAAISRSFEVLVPILADDLIVPFFEFLVDEEVLGDPNAEVRAGMLAAATKVIDIHGDTRLQELISMFERHLAAASPPTEAADYVKEAVVILLGRIAGHLNQADSRIPSVVSRLTTALKTPSEQVQIAVSECLAPLVKLTESTKSKLVEDLLQELFNAPKYGERRGAAYGLAGIMKGTGITGLKDHDIVERLRLSLEDKKRYETRQGAMFLLETLSATLRRNFEPYVVELLPSLLSSFGDASSDVREAAEDAAKVIMSNLSGYGVKKVLPTLLDTLEEKQWRTKKGAIELLGTMAYCSPRQLSISLPTVIPRLTSVLTDSHTQVRTAANKSLKQFGEVISNPEIQSMVPVLLKALVDPAKTAAAMTSLLKKSFVHYIDMPSLALVVPVIERGLRERGADAKRKAAQIVGNLASLTDSQDFIPYLDKLLPLVNVVLVDPVPEARATAAKALGTLVERLGEEQFPDMVPGLLRTLRTDSSGVDRLGAAQGLSEVLAGLGMERMEALLPDIVSNAQSPRSTVREGFMSLLVYLPATFGSRFQPHLTKIVGPILSGLSDSEEPVRDAAMKAGRMVINNYSSKAIDLLLPELERGMFDSSWRIRHSSITLVGELLFKITGISGKAEIEEEDEEVEATVADSSRKALDNNLGKERRDRVLTALYIVRQDAVAVVRQSSIHIWKALVSNTPRTVRELLPELVSQLVALLVDDDSDESPETASRTFGEICRKFGERILGEMVSLLRNKSGSPDYRTRAGVCLALVDIMESATDTQRGGHENDIVAIVRSSLVDDEENVRAAAAKAFDSLQEHLGARAIDQTIPTLLEALRQPGESSGTALQALKEVMNVRANSVFPVLIPTLIASPMTVFNAHALASLVTVAGPALSRRLNQVLGALVGFMEQDNNEELSQALDEAIRALLGSLSDAEGLNNLMMILLDWIQTGSPTRRASACKIFGAFCEESELDDSLYRIDWIRQLVRLLDDSEVAVHTSAWQALDLFVKSIPKEELEPLVVTLRRSIESAGAPGRTVPGLSLPKGVSPLVPIIIAGLTTGSNEQRENAAYAIGDLVTRTDEDALKPFVVPFTGPLIRVAAQSTTYPPGVKIAIISALTMMLLHIPAFVKPFFPQLQRTFVKATSDPSSLAVRSKAAIALGVLMKSQPRVDPVITELIAGARGGDDAIGSSYVSSLAQVVRSAGDNVGQKVREACVELVEDAFKESHDDYYVQSVAALFAALAQFPGLVKNIVQQYLVAGTPPSALSSQMILAVLSLDEEDDQTDGANLFQQLDILPSISRKIQESIGTDKSSISRPAREAKERLGKL